MPKAPCTYHDFKPTLFAGLEKCRKCQATRGKIAPTVADTLDAKAGAEHRDRAIARVEKAADPTWKEQALQAVEQLACAFPQFNADDLWAFGVPKPLEARAAGPVFLRAVALGYIEDSGEFTRSEQVGTHRMPRRIWRSRIYTG